MESSRGEKWRMKCTLQAGAGAEGICGGDQGDGKGADHWHRADLSDVVSVTRREDLQDFRRRAVEELSDFFCPCLLQESLKPHISIDQIHASVTLPLQRFLLQFQRSVLVAIILQGTGPILT